MQGSWFDKKKPAPELVLKRRFKLFTKIKHSAKRVEWKIHASNPIPPFPQFNINFYLQIHCSQEANFGIVYKHKNRVGKI